MDRRDFLIGLAGAAGAASLAGMAIGQAQAAPIARTLDAQPPPREPQISEADDAYARSMQAPDGTPIDEAQYRRHWWRRSRRWRRRRRRRWRRVCRRVWRRGRWRRYCRRVWGGWY